MKTEFHDADFAGRGLCHHPISLEEEVTDLFEQLRNPLFRYLLSLGLSTHDGEEIIQEVFLALFQHLKSGKPRDNLRGWIFRVGHNQALKVRRRQGAQPDQAEGDAIDGSPDPEQQTLQNQRQRRLSAVIRALAQTGPGVPGVTRGGHTVSRDRGNSGRVAGNGRAVAGAVARQT